MRFRISVIIPVYNAEKYLEQAVISAISQGEVSEVILTEDGSTDNSLQLCQELEMKFDKIKLLSHPNYENKGAGASRNLGITNAECEYIAFLDADDYYLPNRFKKASEIFNKNPEVDGVYEAVGTHFEDQNAKDKWFKYRNYHLTTIKKRITPKKLLSLLSSCKYGSFHTNGIVFKKSLVNKTGLFNTKLKLSQDSEFFIKMAATGVLVAGELNEPVAMRRVHEGNRILKDIQTEKKYHLMMTDMLIEWGKENNLPKKKINCFFTLYSNIRFRYVNLEQNSFFKKRILELIEIFRMLKKYPEMFFYQTFWHILSYRYIENGFLLFKNKFKRQKNE
ncbi:MAG: glycosyltransferase family A protein [Candidatus Delongbacteria bacterium]|jgi:glycosyltransferase involved in cell wall biosynthesis|nr:glycosyltransferase family A protein [Candidatus Delongbacteria bacterium]